MSLAEFGSRVMQWGTGYESAVARIGTVTSEELAREEVTLEMAEQWRDYYQEVVQLTPRNESARGRVELMQHAAMLLRGDEIGPGRAE